MSTSAYLTLPSRILLPLAGGSFLITFNARHSNHAFYPTYSNLGSKWTFNCSQFVLDDPSQPLANVRRQRITGGFDTYASFDDTTGFYDFQPRSSTKLKKSELVPTAFILPMAAGKFTDSRMEPFPEAAVFSSQRRSISYGNELNFQYDSSCRLVKLIDATGKETSITYSYTPDPYRITAITDPYGRVATFKYHVDGHLASTTDTMGIESKFLYAAPES